MANVFCHVIAKGLSFLFSKINNMFHKLNWHLHLKNIFNPCPSALKE